MSGTGDGATHRVQRDDVTLHVVERGPADGPPVVLVHGWPDTHQVWRRVVPLLVGAGHRVVAYDQRGFGSSDAPDAPGAYRVREAGADLLAVLDALGIGAAHLVGHDWGAPVCWGTAALAPARVATLTALSVGHPDTVDHTDLHQQRRSWYMLLFQFPDAAERWLAEDDWAGLRALAPDAPDLERAVAALGRPGRLTASLRWYRDNMHPDGWARDGRRLPVVEVPAQGLGGSDDVFLAPAQLTGSAAHVAGPWRCEVLDGVGHWVQLEAAARTAELVAGWAADHGRAVGGA